MVVLRILIHFGLLMDQVAVPFYHCVGKKISIT